MTLDTGVRLGPYEILSPIGAGGMGEVYLASDTRLDRRVAIKVLPPQWSTDHDMRARFEKEARIVAGLSHPHICTLYDVGRQGDIEFLVMEYLEGQTLSERIRRGALGVEEALGIAIQIAEALSVAHQEGITHRDLKPGNVMLTKSGAKLLDFGLAKQQETLKSRSLSTSTLPTREEATMQGAIVGTMQYMAPEQLEGKEVTPQSDIFAFGAVLYEMLTGRKAFISDSPAGLISAIMTTAPAPISAVLPVSSPALEFALTKCLDKDPSNRWHSAHDLGDHLRWTLKSPGATLSVSKAAPQRSLFAKLLIPISVILAAAAVVLVIPYLKATPDAEAVQFVLNSDISGASFAISPDGRRIVYAGRVSDTEMRALFIREMGSVTPRQLAGTEGAVAPFWSPDAKRVGFFVESALKTVGTAGEAPEKICDAPGNNRAGAWNRDNVIVFSSNNVLSRVSSSGGTPVQLTSLNLSRAETLHTLPSFLPDGRHFLFMVYSQQIADRAIYLGSLESKETKRLLSVRSPAAYSSGNLLYVDSGALVAQPFDPKMLTLSSSPVRVAGQVANFSVSENGVLAYRAAPPPNIPVSQYVWFDRAGKQVSTAAGEPGAYLPYWSLSPDSKQVAATRIDLATSNVDIWVVDLERGISSRLTSDPLPDGDGRWSPDGLRIAYTTQEKGNRDIYEKRANGIGPETPVLNSPEPESLDDWSPDGRYIVYRTGANTNTIYALPMFGDRKPFPVIESEFNKDGSHVSFDSEWLAYNAIESGSSQVYVVSFPKPDQKRQVSIDGGVQPHWRKDNKELYYLSPAGKMMVVDMTTAPSLSSATPRVLFDTGLANPSFDGDDYAVTPDGQRFLVLKPLSVQPAAAPQPPVTILVNWIATLKSSNSK
jgi:serine/threonine protein kinase/Tol biopolymer transport system component